MMSTLLPLFVTVAILALSLGKTLDYSEEISDLDISLERKNSSVDIKTNAPSTCPRHAKPADCAELFENGHRTNGIYEIYPKNRIVQCETVKVFCNMITDGGGWTSILRRGDNKRNEDYFYKDWNDYKKGFGDLREDFWLGNDNIYALTNQKKYIVRFDLRTVRNEKAYALYDSFWIDNEDQRYKLHIDGYRGNAGDSMAVHNNMFFTTKDRKNDKNTSNCAHTFKGGWWYNKCHDANLNGLYVKHVNTSSWENIIWATWKGYNESLEYAEMKIRPFEF